MAGQSLNPAKPGRKHIFLTYRRTMDRLWQATFVLGLLLSGLWYWGPWIMPSLQPPNDKVILAGALFLLAFTLFALGARNAAYAQAYPDHLRLVTPFLRLKISYRRVRSVGSKEFRSQFSYSELPWTEKEFLQPFLGATLLQVELTEYPLSRKMLKLFLPWHIFSRQGTGFVLLVKDWMGLSSEIDSRMSNWRQKNRQKENAFYSPYSK